mmetsp:Transcript_136462/g.353757  ORF Transcript_136462/g.353757 Transcript_136462/m.353757 type:complete len:284 (+) Transcript_136462:238-1089(+)
MYGLAEACEPWVQLPQIPLRYLVLQLLYNIRKELIRQDGKHSPGARGTLVHVQMKNHSHTHAGHPEVERIALQLDLPFIEFHLEDDWQHCPFCLKHHPSKRAERWLHRLQATGAETFPPPGVHVIVSQEETQAGSILLKKLDDHTATLIRHLVIDACFGSYPRGRTGHGFDSLVCAGACTSVCLRARRLCARADARPSFRVPSIHPRCQASGSGTPNLQGSANQTCGAAHCAGIDSCQATPAGCCEAANRRLPPLPQLDGLRRCRQGPVRDPGPWQSTLQLCD